MNHAVVLLFAQKIEALIDSNTIQPGRQTRILMEIVQMAPSLDKHVLKDIVGIFMNKHQTTNLPVELFAILAYHLFERLTLCRGVRQLLHQQLFFLLGHST